MLTAAVLACGASVMWTALVVFANLMPDAEFDAVGRVFQYGGWLSLGACWLVTVGLFLWWGVH
jgi:hypothetical protein